MSQPSSVVQRGISYQAKQAMPDRISVHEETHVPTPIPVILYIGMQMIEEQGNDEVSVLMQDTSYRLDVYTDPNSTSELSQRRLTLTTDVEILVKCKTENNPGESILIANPTRTLTYDNLAASTVEERIDISVPKNSFKGNATFEVYWSRLDKPRYSLATSMSIDIDGPYNADDSIIRTCQIDVSNPLPDATAILYVKKTDIDKLHITCLYDYTDPVEVDARNWHPPSLAEYAKEARYQFKHQLAGTLEPAKEVVKKIIKLLRSNSTQSPRELQAWLRKLLLLQNDTTKKNVRLIIVDDTDFEIPWELLEVDDKYLGAQVAIVRWAQLHHYADNLLLHIQNEQRQGTVLAYLDEKELGLEQTDAERMMLTHLNATVYDKCDQLAAGIARDDALKQVGLIYMGCHGNEGMVLGIQKSAPSPESLTYIDLEEAITHKEPRPIVFINACESALLKHFEDGHADGLLRVFLARYASGYIGTLGQVISTYASKIAKCILQTAITEADGVQVAEILRQLRAEAASMVARNQTIAVHPDIIAQMEQRELTAEEKHFYFFYVFMYVFYGNPLARLQLTQGHEVQGI